MVDIFLHCSQLIEVRIGNRTTIQLFQLTYVDFLLFKAISFKTKPLAAYAGEQVKHLVNCLSPECCFRGVGTKSTS